MLEKDVNLKEEKELVESEPEFSGAENTELEVNSEIAEEKLNEVFENQKPKNRKKSTIVSLVLLLVNIIFMIIVVNKLIENVGEQNFDDYIKFSGNKLWWLLGGLGCYLFYIFTQTIMIKSLVKNLTGKSRWKLSYDVGLIGKYYDNVTPFAVGGQPIQIVRLASSGISAGKSTSIPLMKMIINSVVSALLALGFFIWGLPGLLTGAINDFFVIIFAILGIIGLVISLIAVLFMILISTGSLFTRSLISWVVKVGYKLKLVKNYRETLKKWLDQVNEYNSSMKYLLKNKWLLLKMIIYSVLESISYASISFFVIMAFIDIKDFSPIILLLSCITKYYICSMAGSFIPLPGATGLMELAFIALYGGIVGNNIVWALLIWRFLTYYIIVIHGFIHELIRIIKNIVKNKKLETK